MYETTLCFKCWCCSFRNQFSSRPFTSAKSKKGTSATTLILQPGSFLSPACHRIVRAAKRFTFTYSDGLLLRDHKPRGASVPLIPRASPPALQLRSPLPIFRRCACAPSRGPPCRPGSTPARPCRSSPSSRPAHCTTRSAPPLIHGASALIYPVVTHSTPQLSHLAA